MSVFDNESHFNSFMVSTGYRVDSGNGASAYIVFKRMEKRIYAYIAELKNKYADPKYYHNLDPVGRVKLENTIERSLDKVKYLVVKRLDAISDIDRLHEYSEMETEDIVRIVNMGCVVTKIEKVLHS